MNDALNDQDGEEEDIILADLSDEELTEQMHDDLYDGLRDEIEEGTQILLDRGWPPEKVLAEALVAGMTIVGIDFRDGILFVPEVLLSANSMKGGMDMKGKVTACTDSFSEELQEGNLNCGTFRCSKTNSEQTELFAHISRANRSLPIMIQMVFRCSRSVFEQFRLLDKSMSSIFEKV